ncbi:MAG: hypothetical protein AAF633_03560 [Chloroflexota bacterium]
MSEKIVEGTVPLEDADVVYLVPSLIEEMLPLSQPAVLMQRELFDQQGLSVYITSDWEAVRRGLEAGTIKGLIVHQAAVDQIDDSPFLAEQVVRECVVFTTIGLDIDQYNTLLNDRVHLEFFEEPELTDFFITYYANHHSAGMSSGSLRDESAQFWPSLHTPIGYVETAGGCPDWDAVAARPTNPRTPEETGIGPNLYRIEQRGDTLSILMRVQLDARWGIETGMEIVPPSGVSVGSLAYPRLTDQDGQEIKSISISSSPLRTLEDGGVFSEMTFEFGPLPTEYSNLIFETDFEIMELRGDQPLLLDLEGRGENEAWEIDQTISFGPAIYHFNRVEIVNDQIELYADPNDVYPITCFYTKLDPISPNTADEYRHGGCGEFDNPSRPLAIFPLAEVTENPVELYVRASIVPDVPYLWGISPEMIEIAAAEPNDLLSSADLGSSAFSAPEPINSVGEQLDEIDEIDEIIELMMQLSERAKSVTDGQSGWLY